ncbi:MAG: LD-carboxypeptidase, partial [Acidobacteriota bacterium]
PRPPVAPPPPVRPGDRVGVAALSGPVDPAQLDAGVRALEELGFEVVEAANVRRRHGLFAGTERERLDGFHALAADPDVRAILFARGGWGVLRLLDGVDWPLLARHPRAYVGYSDLTPFLGAVVERLGIAAFHGPMVAADFARGLLDAERSSFLDALAGRFPLRYPIAEVESTQAVEGPLLGGCLSLIASSFATPWAGEWDDALLFIEDVGEPPYRFDRMLTHLRLSGTLARIRGLIVGHLHAEGGCEATAWGGEVTLGGLLHELASDFPWPLARGLEAGHSSPNLTLPLGLTARLEPATRSLTVGLVPPSASLTGSPP